MPRLSLSNTCSSLLKCVGWGNGVPRPNVNWPWGCLASTTMTSRYISSSKWTQLYHTISLQSSIYSATCLPIGLMITQSWNMPCCMLSWLKGLTDSLHYPSQLSFGLWLCFEALCRSLSFPAWFNSKTHFWDTWIIKEYSAYLLP